MMKQLRKEGFTIGRYRVRKRIARLKLVVKCKPHRTQTTDSKHTQPVADNMLERQFQPTAAHQGMDITYLWTLQGWVYLAVVLDLYFRQVIGWRLDDSMKTALIIRALIMVVNLRSPSPGLLHHSDRAASMPARNISNCCRNTVWCVP